MASTSGTLWNESVIVPNKWSGGQLVTPEVKSTATYQCERNGSQLKIKIDTSNHCTSRGAYWDWRWAFSVSVNGVDIASNIQIKPRTYLNTIGTTVYSATTGWATINIGSANSVVVSVRYYDTQAYNNSIERHSMGGGSLTLKNIPQLPSVSISQNSKTHNSIRVNYSTGGSYDYVRIFLNNNKYRDFTGSPVTISNLSPNTTYKIFAKAHGNGGFGGRSNTLTIKTYLTPSTVSSNKIENLEPFSCSAYMTSSNANNTSKYEFALCDINKKVLDTTIENVGTIEDVDKLKDFQLLGKTAQNGTPTPDTPQEIKTVTGRQVINVGGKNLFNKNNIISRKYIDSSGNLVNDSSNFIGDYIKIDINKKYFISASTGNSKRIAYYNNEKAFISRQLIPTTDGLLVIPTEAKYVRLSCYNVDLDTLQLEQNIMATEYEEYKGNTYEVNLGKNLLPNNGTTTTINGITFTANEDGTILVSGTANATAYLTHPTFSLKAGIYTLSAGVYVNQLTRIQLVEDISGRPLLASTQNASSQTFTIATTKNVFLQFRINAGEVINTTFYPQLEKGSQATSYSPYFEPIELCQIGNYQDRIYKDNDKWYVEKQIGKVVLDSNLSGVASTNFSNVYQIFANVMNISYLIGGFCDNFKFNDDSRITDNTNANNYLSDNQCALRLGNESARDRFYVKSTNFASANELKAYFNTNPTALYYVLANPTITPIENEELINQLNAIQLLEGINNISIDGDLGAILKLEYYDNTLEVIEDYNVVQGAYQTNNSYYNFTGMQEETSYYIRYRVQSKDSGSWSNYVYSPLFKTPADQVRAWGKINGSWNKGKVFLKKDGQWVKAKKAYVKINGEWILSINKYD